MTSSAQPYALEAALATYSAPALLLLACAAVFVFAKARIAKDRYYTPLGQKVLPALAAVAFPFLVVASLGPALLAILGLVFRAWTGQLEWGFLSQELSSGVLGLRVASVLVAYQVLSLEVGRLELSIGKTQLLSKDDRKRRDSHLLIAEMQYLFYGVATAALWHTRIEGHTSIVATIVSWSLLFILDDWGVMKDYLLYRNALPTKLHYCKVVAFNLALLLTVGSVFLAASAWLYALFFMVPVLCIVPFWAVNYHALWARILRAESAA